MIAQPNQHLAIYLKRAAQAAALVVAATGILVLGGWQFGIPALKSILPGLATMKANTAFAFILAGFALLLETDEKRGRLKKFAAQAMAGIVALIGLLTLGEYLFKLNFGIDQLIYQDIQTPPASFPGRMSITTALNFSLLGIALLIIDLELRGRFRPAQILALTAGGLSSIALIGYLYGVESLYSVGAYSSMALHTALSFALLSLGVLGARPEKGVMQIVVTESVGGVVLRRLMPLAILILIILGWLRLRGQQAGLYDTNFGLALMVMLSAFLLSSLIWFNARWINREETRRKEAEEAVRRSQSHQASIINSVMDAVITMDEDQHILIFNPAAEKMFQRFADKVIGKPLTMLIPERLRAKHEQDVRAFSRTSVTKRSMGRLGMVYGLRANGEEFPLEASISQIEINGKKNFTAILRDVTERKRDETALRESEERFHNVLDSMLEGFQIIGFDWKYLYLNDAVIKQSRRRRDELLGRTMMEAYPGIEETAMFAALRKCMNERRSQVMENEFVYPDGTRAWYQLVIQPAPEGIFVLSSDITERKRVEQALREAEARYRTLVEQVPNAVTYIDSITPETAIFFVSPQIKAMLGYSPQEWMARPDSWSSRLHPDDRRQMVEANEKHHASGEPFDQVYRLIARDDHTVWIRDQAVIVRDEAGQPKYSHGIMINITEQKQAEEQINRLNADLEERVQLRTAQLESANKELEAFSYSVSHDLRAPLRSIDGFSRILLEDYGPQLDDEARRYLKIVRDNTQQMGQLIEDLLNFARVSRQPLEFQEVKPGQLARETLANLRAEQDGRQVEIVLGDLPPCRGDPKVLKQVFVNLLANALKFTRHQAVARIEIGSLPSDSDEEQTYFVKDNGVGFDMQYAEKLFGVFQRLHGTDEFEGTGVGLAIVQRVIHRHGGRVWAAAEVNKGATFYFTLPTERLKTKPAQTDKDTVSERAREII